LRAAIISDIHSNLEALNAVLSQIKKEQIDKIVCLGDIIGYGPKPNECVSLVKEVCAQILLGNHDAACVNKSELLFFNRFAKEAIEWTHSVIEEKNLDFLANLDLKGFEDNIFFVHSNPYSPQSWDYILSLDDAVFNFSKFKEQVCFIGHSHQPIIFIESNDQEYSAVESSEIEIQPGFRYIINVGSVGQPRDKNPAAAFGILDTVNKAYELIRVGYDVEKTRRDMINAGLPDFLANRLLEGK